MGPSANNQGGFKLMTLGSMKKVVRKSWYEIPMTDTVISRVKPLGQGKHNRIEFLFHKKIPIGELDITLVDAVETESPYIQLKEPYTNLNHISAGA